MQFVFLIIPLKINPGKADIAPIGAGYQHLPGTHLLKVAGHKLMTFPLAFEGCIAPYFARWRYAVPRYNLVTPFLLVKKEMYFATGRHCTVREIIVVIVFKLAFGYDAAPVGLPILINAQYQYLIIKIANTLVVVKCIEGAVVPAISRAVPIIIIR